jgi:hypothetical protein
VILLKAAGSNIIIQEVKEECESMKAKIFNAYTGFVLGITLIAAITFIPLTCPACGGTGVVTGAKSLQVAGVEADLIKHYELGLQCGWDFERYTYDVRVQVENKTANEAFGTIMVTFHNPSDVISIVVEREDEEVLQTYTGKTLESFPIFVQIPAETTRTIEKTIVFDGVSLNLFQVDKHQIEAYTESEFTCPFHGKKAVVILPEWFRLKKMLR